MGSVSEALRGEVDRTTMSHSRKKLEIVSPDKMLYIERCKKKKKKSAVIHLHSDSLGRSQSSQTLKAYR